MKKLTKRLITFFVAIPAIGALILLLPFHHHLALNLAIVAVTIIGAFETAGFFYKKGYPVDKYVSFFSGLLPLAAYIEISGLLTTSILEITFTIIITVILLRQIVAKKEEDFPSILPRIAASFTIILYPGIFSAYLVKLSGLPNSSFLLAFFFLLVYLNDAMAYVFGMIFGWNSRKLLLVSPNKSLTGFIAGFITSIIVSAVFRLLFPYMFSGSPFLLILLGAWVGIAAIAGDLIESALKRSVELKDSGVIIPGRGGILDSVDSLLFSAPFFYYLMILVT
ncbi:MAG: phosphatidate cytidylyltransferase [Spirochaetes bacterium]|nr:MAG: phosphatidate cytidylyltransferase [Spirochaetota bacterium]